MFLSTNRDNRPQSLQKHPPARDVVQLVIVRLEKAIVAYADQFLKMVKLSGAVNLQPRRVTCLNDISPVAASDGDHFVIAIKPHQILTNQVI